MISRLDGFRVAFLPVYGCGLYEGWDVAFRACVAFFIFPGGLVRYDHDDEEGSGQGTNGIGDVEVEPTATEPPNVGSDFPPMRPQLWFWL